jgi:hypothetical protein
VLPLQHSELSLQGLPSGVHEAPLLGSLHAVYCVLLPEQQALGVVVSVSGPMHVQTPLLHVPEMHSALLVQAAPFARCSWHVPSSQSVEAQLLFAAHGAPSGPGA